MKKNLKNLEEKDYKNWCRKHVGSLWLASAKESGLNSHILIMARSDTNKYIMVTEKGNRWVKPGNAQKIYNLLDNKETKSWAGVGWKYSFIQDTLDFNKLITNKTYKILFTEGDDNVK